MRWPPRCIKLPVNHHLDWNEVALSPNISLDLSSISLDPVQHFIGPDQHFIGPVQHVIGPVQHKPPDGNQRHHSTLGIQAFQSSPVSFQLSNEGRHRSNGEGCIVQRMKHKWGKHETRRPKGKKKNGERPSTKFSSVARP
ncbi:hypothetical protein TNCV_1559281 [Trichonephila clavipes]|nr:hypothetical protein TNCV_1559281 [Trichonephila clavipes]